MTAAVNDRILERNAGSMYWTWPQLSPTPAATRPPAGRCALLPFLGSGTVGTAAFSKRFTPAAVGGWLKPGDRVELTVERLDAKAIASSNTHLFTKQMQRVRIIVGWALPTRPFANGLESRGGICISLQDIRKGAHPYKIAHDNIPQLGF